MDRQYSLAILTALCVGLLVSPATAGVVLGLNNPGSFTEREIAVQPGETFLLDVTVETTVEIFDFYDVRFVASESHMFVLRGGVYQAPWRGIGPIRAGNLDPISPRFGVFFPEPDYFGPGVTAVATLSMSVSSDAPEDTYTIYVGGGERHVCRDCPAVVPVDRGPDFIVNVIPEPASLLLLAAGAVILRRRRA